MWDNREKVVLSFDKVCFSYNDGKNIVLNEANFSVRENTKITIMWQNWAGKSTTFKLISWELKPITWKVNLANWYKIAVARQLLAKEFLDMTVREYFETAFKDKDYQLDKKISDVLQEVNFTAPINKKLKEYSWGQQARLLLAHALIQNPDILLMDEPTNNLDRDWIWDLISFLLSYDKTVIVISHDTDFLNMFTDGVLYLNKNNNTIEQYWWDYYKVLDEIAAQIEKEKMQNARAQKEIEDKKEKINFFANKWGKMRKLAAKLKEDVEEAKETKVVIRKDDKTVHKFEIEFENYIWPIVTINSISTMNKFHKVVNHDVSYILKKWDKVIFAWPNWIWKSTLLKRIVENKDKWTVIWEEVRVWYYSQDFDALDMNMVVWDSLHEVTNEITDQEVYRVAAQFLLTWPLLKSTIWSLSEWQKWLLCYARFVIQKPHLLILDEPTNHINFRHLPIIAQALNDFKGAIIMVSHDEPFTSKLKWFDEIDLTKLARY